MDVKETLASADSATSPVIPPAPVAGVRRLVGWFRPAPPQPRSPQAEIDRLYPLQRWRVFEAAFIAYATFYLVRNNLSPVAQSLTDTLHYDNEMLGHILSGTAMAYGLGKFVMGYLADRCDARKYMATGMLLTAAVNFAFAATRNYSAHVFLWTLNGFVQGMGYAPAPVASPTGSASMRGERCLGPGTFPIIWEAVLRVCSPRIAQNSGDGPPLFTCPA
jgi:hypothetical protein